MENQEKQIAELIISYASRQAGEVLGSELGHLVRSEFPEVNLRVDYGGLHRFITQFCGGELIWIQKRGGNDVYMHSSKRSIHGKLVDTPLASPSTETAWRAFSNPLSSAVLLISADGQLDVAINEGHTKEGFATIPPLSRGEHRQIAREFASQLEDAYRQPLEATLEVENYWPIWQAKIRAMPGAVSSDWVKFRSERIVSAFMERLRQAGLTEGAIARAVDAFRKSRSPLQPKTAHEFRSGLASTRQAGVTLHLRSAIQVVVGQLPAEDLRRLWLPVGTLLDALGVRTSD